MIDARIEHAIRAIPAGRRILIGSGAAEPSQLVNGLVTAGEHLGDNEIVHLLTLGPAPYVAPGLERRFRHTAFFIGENTRAAIAEGRADYLPVFLSEIPSLIRSRRVRVDVALIQVSPPDRRGFVSLGVSVDIVRAAVETADLVIAEINRRMPRTHGDSFLHRSRIHHAIDVDVPLPEHAPEPLDEVARAIGRHVAGLIPDGATLQTGIGKLPDGVLAALDNHHDLGVHTEMLSDGVMRLVERGNVTGRKKTQLPGKLVTSFVMGSRALYEWVDDHPMIEMRPSDYTNDPSVIARQDRMIAVNAALAVDLTGQVAADTLGGRFYSGIGGQVDFIRGAARSREGKAILALRSTAKGGAVSRIMPVLDAGAGIVTSRGDVRYVVTEFGVADLWGRSVRERAQALIAIAHPDHRSALLDAARARHYVLPDQRVPRARGPYVEARTMAIGGGTIVLRPLLASDESAVQALLYHLSNESVYKRFLAHRREYAHEEMQAMVDVDDDTCVGLAACLPDSGELVGLARYDVNPATRLGDIAFVVRDELQGRGVGTRLMQQMVAIARARGIAGLEADVLATNGPMMTVFERSGLGFRGAMEDGVMHLEARFAEEK